MKCIIFLRFVNFKLHFNQIKFFSPLFKTTFKIFIFTMQIVKLKKSLNKILSREKTLGTIK
jgi:hypothetical protein